MPCPMTAPRKPTGMSLSVHFPRNFSLFLCLRSEFCLPDRRILWFRWGLAFAGDGLQLHPFPARRSSPNSRADWCWATWVQWECTPQLVWLPPYQSSSDGWSSLHKRWVGLLYMNYFIYSNAPQVSFYPPTETWTLKPFLCALRGSRDFIYLLVKKGLYRVPKVECIACFSLLHSERVWLSSFRIVMLLRFLVFYNCYRLKIGVKS
jgi:hypothetical protein